jgi:putative endonuclease
VSTSGPWYVYILKCSDGRLYTGMTCDVERRLKEHKTGKGARFTRSFGVKKLLYAEPCASRSDAMKREAAIKRYPRQKKLELIKRKK